MQLLITQTCCVLFAFYGCLRHIFFYIRAFTKPYLTYTELHIRFYDHNWTMYTSIFYHQSSSRVCCHKIHICVHYKLYNIFFIDITLFYYFTVIVYVIICELSYISVFFCTKLINSKMHKNEMSPFCQPRNFFCTSLPVAFYSQLYEFKYMNMSDKSTKLTKFCDISFEPETKIIIK